MNKIQKFFLNKMYTKKYGQVRTLEITHTSSMYKYEINQII